MTKQAEQVAHKDLVGGTETDLHSHVAGGGLGTPDYDSGWVSKGAGLQWFTHDLDSMELFVYVRYTSNADGGDNRLFQCHGDAAADRIICANANNIAVDHTKGADKYWRVMAWEL